jgi:hypothetical protein
MADGIFLSTLYPDDRCFAIAVSAVASSIVGAMASLSYAASLCSAENGVKGNS